MRVGARVRLLSAGTVVQHGVFSEVSRSHVEVSRESDGMRNVVMLDDSQLEDLDRDRDWRDVCADMIRLERDADAVSLLLEHSPTCKDDVVWLTLDARARALVALQQLVAAAQDELADSQRTCVDNNPPARLDRAIDRAIAVLQETKL